MKKSLLLIAAVAVSLGASAQGEKAYFASSITGLTTATSQVAGGTAAGSTSLADATVGADDAYKLVSINGPKDANDKSYCVITIDGVTMSEDEPGTAAGGVQGGSNPKDLDGGTPSTTLQAPASGAFFTFKAKGNGYMYVFGKMSSHKSYTAFEEGAAIPYQFAQVTANASLPHPLTYDFTGTGTTVNDVENLTLGDHTGIYWPEQIAAGITGKIHDGVADTTATNGQTPKTWAKIGENGVGFIAFPIFEGLTYIVNANGSKFSGLGFYTSTAKAQNISVATDDNSSTAQLVKDGQLVGATTGIEKITTDSKKAFNAMDPIYNLAGQRVSGAYKGVVIQNGQKFILK